MQKAEVNFFCKNAKQSTHKFLAFKPHDLGSFLIKDIEDKVQLPQQPYCEKVEMACLPEDCGGISGYENLVRVLSNPKDEEYESMLMWLGGKYEAKTFDLNLINEELRLNFK